MANQTLRQNGILNRLTELLSLPVSTEQQEDKPCCWTKW